MRDDSKAFLAGCLFGLAVYLAIQAVLRWLQ